ncbi:MAG: Y-family DNA polymerase [Cyanobacteria bacterium J06597_1]
MKPIALVDCNNFYCSCERVFQPKWTHRPIAVLSNNDGCIVSRSNELKALGVPMGAPYFKWKSFLATHQAIVVSSNYSLYGDMSARVMSTLGQFTPNIDIYSIDEAWLELAHVPRSDLIPYAETIGHVVRQWTGIPVSIGIAPTRVLAKIANRLAKRQGAGGVFDWSTADFTDDSTDALLETIAVEDIWGIGRRWGDRLRRVGITTARDLKAADPDRIRQKFSVVMQRIVLELRGVPSIETEDIAPKQQIIRSRSFGQRVTSLDHLRQAVTMHVSRAAEKLRAQHSVCGLAQVSIRTGLHNPREVPYSNHAIAQFPVPTADTRRLVRGVLTALESIYREGYRYAKAGVMLMDLSSDSGVQSDLFHSTDSERSRRLMTALDTVNQGMGRGSLFLAGQGNPERVPWLMKRGKTTPAYTTQWSDLMVVK